MSRDPAISVFRPDRPGIRKVLGDLEAEIMEEVWARPADPGTTVRDVFAVLYARRGTAYTTVMSTMARLARKGLLEAEKAGIAYIYRPRFTQEEFVSRFVGRILENLTAAIKTLHVVGHPSIVLIDRKGVAQAPIFGTQSDAKFRPPVVALVGQ